MTVTEASRAVTPVAAETSPQAPARGVAAVVGSGDPRTIGQLFVGTSFAFLLAAGVVGVLVGFDRVDTADNAIFGDDLARAYSFHAITGLFLVVLPLLLGLASAIVPLQVGASTLAFPRLTAASYWTYLVSGGLLAASYLVDGGPGGTDAAGVELFLLSLIAVLVALTFGWVSVATTVLTLRAPGLTLRRVPMFAWSAMTAGVVWALALPVLAAMMLLAWVDLRHGSQLFPDGSDEIYNRIAWVFWQPTLYGFAVPALGIVTDIVPTYARRRLFKHSAALFLLGLLATVGFGAWVQLPVTIDGSSATPPWLFDGPWMAVSIVAIVAVLGLFGLWANTLRLGAPRFGAPLVVGLSGALLILGGIAAGGATIVDAADLDGTTWMTAQANLVLIGTLTAAVAGLAYWAPKLYGKLLPEPLIGLGGLLLLLGTLVYAVPDLISGVIGQVRLMAGGAVPEADVDTVETLNLVSAIGAVAVVAGVAIVVLALAKPRGSAEVADDPWEGNTLEWATTSPPTVGNFPSLPPVASEAPVYDARHASTEGAK
jgi:heme/copper-type cytochrome/quinol oxidase subunit 1